MKRPFKRKNSGKYDPHLKIAIVREYFTTDLGYKALGVKYNIPSTTIVEFIKWYKKKYPDGVVETSVAASDQKPLNEDNLKIVALEMLIENASKELGIDLVKKFGTKQPKK